MADTYQFADFDMFGGTIPNANPDNFDLNNYFPQGSTSYTAGQMPSLGSNANGMAISTAQGGFPFPIQHQSMSSDNQMFATGNQNVDFGATQLDEYTFTNLADFGSDDIQIPNSAAGPILPSSGVIDNTSASASTHPMAGNSNNNKKSARNNATSEGVEISEEVAEPKKKRNRRKKAPLSEEQKQKKRDEFLARNRNAAQKCREKKKKENANLLASQEILQAEYKSKYAAAEMLEKEVAYWFAISQSFLAKGGCGGCGPDCGSLCGKLQAKVGEISQRLETKELVFLRKERAVMHAMLETENVLAMESISRTGSAQSQHVGRQAMSRSGSFHSQSGGAQPMSRGSSSQGYMSGSQQTSRPQSRHGFSSAAVRPSFQNQSQTGPAIPMQMSSNYGMQYSEFSTSIGYGFQGNPSVAPYGMDIDNRSTMQSGGFAVEQYASPIAQAPSMSRQTSTDRSSLISRQNSMAKDSGIGGSPPDVMVASGSIGDDEGYVTPMTSNPRLPFINKSEGFEHQPFMPSKIW